MILIVEISAQKVALETHQALKNRDVALEVALITSTVRLVALRAIQASKLREKAFWEKGE